MKQWQDQSNTSNNSEEMIYDPKCGMTQEEFEWRQSQYKIASQSMPQVLDELKTNSQRMRLLLLDDPDALAKWDEYVNDVHTAFSSNLKRSSSSTPRLPDSVLYKHLMRRKTCSKSLVDLYWLKQAVKNKVSVPGAISIAAGIAVGLAIAPACWNQWKGQQNGEA